MNVEITLPELGEDSVTDVTVSSWLVEIGCHLHEGDEILEITTDKAAFSLPAPQGGVLLEQCVLEGDLVAVGEVICILEV